MLQGLSFTMNAGDFVVVLGVSGSGKSSLGRLVPRLYEASKGSVLFNGVDVRKLDVRELRERMAVVPQARMGVREGFGGVGMTFIAFIAIFSCVLWHALAFFVGFVGILGGRNGGDGQVLALVWRL